MSYPILIVTLNADVMTMNSTICSLDREEDANSALRSIEENKERLEKGGIYITVVKLFKESIL
jgi:hypothetical protein